jgi:hypothetical protein
MTDVLTLRLPPGKLAKVDRRAAELGQERSRYIRGLIDEDLRGAAKPRKHVFASEDLVGCVETGIVSSSSAHFRKIIRERLIARHGKNRRHRSA